jgi:2-methylcitrate dehydratase PrpD
LARLSPERVRYMFSYTAQQAAGLSSMLRDHEHVEKAYAMGGMPAHNGVQAALLAAHGFTGVSDVFSGDRNFFCAYAPEADPRRLTRELGKTYEIANTSIKRWPVGSPILAALDATQTLIRTHAFKAADVDRVVVKLAPDRARVVDDRAMPDICLQHMVAVMLLDGAVTLKSSHDFKRMRDPKTMQLRKRIELIGSAKMADPQRRWQARVEIALRDGRTLAHYTHAAPGYYQNPISREDEEEKALDLLAPVTGAKRAKAVIASVWNIEKVKDTHLLGTLCRPQ